MRLRVTGRAGATFGDVAIVFASFALLGALIYPRFREGAFEARVAAVAAHVERIRSAADQARVATGSWPGTGPVAEVAPPVTGTGAGSATDDHASDVLLEWRRLESVEVPPPPVGLEDSIPEQLDEVAQDRPAPPPIFFHQGAISVHSGDEALLGALMRRYPDSFVHDTVWTLLLPRVRVPDAS